MLALQLLAILPRHPVLTFDDIAEELGLGERTLRRLISEMRSTGIAIERQIMNDGHWAYFVSQNPNDFTQRILAYLNG